MPKFSGIVSNVKVEARQKFFSLSRGAPQFRRHYKNRMGTAKSPVSLVGVTESILVLSC